MAAGSGASWAPLLSYQQKRGKQERQAADADRDQDKLKEWREVGHFRHAVGVSIAWRPKRPYDSAVPCPTGSMPACAFRQPPERLSLLGRHWPVVGRCRLRGWIITNSSPVHFRSCWPRQVLKRL